MENEIQEEKTFHSKLIESVCSSVHDKDEISYITGAIAIIIISVFICAIAPMYYLYALIPIICALLYIDVTLLFHPAPSIYKIVYFSDFIIFNMCLFIMFSYIFIIVAIIIGIIAAIIYLIFIAIVNCYIILGIIICLFAIKYILFKLYKVVHK